MHGVRNITATALLAITFTLTILAPSSAVAFTKEPQLSSPSHTSNFPDPYSYSKFIEAASYAGYTSQEVKNFEEFFTQNYILEENSLTPASNYVPNGCSDPRSWSSYKQTFLPACNTHDYCYSAQYNFRRSRAECDNNFYSSMRSICNFLYSPHSSKNISCLNESSVYYWAVRTFGRPHYKGSGDPS